MPVLNHKITSDKSPIVIEHLSRKRIAASIAKSRCTWTEFLFQRWRGCYVRDPNSLGREEYVITFSSKPSLREIDSLLWLLTYVSLQSPIRVFTKRQPNRFYVCTEATRETMVDALEYIVRLSDDHSSLHNVFAGMFPWLKHRDNRDVNLYWYRCKKSCYSEISKDPALLHAEAFCADERWRRQEQLKEGVPSEELANPWFPQKCEHFLHEEGRFVLVNGPMARGGTAYRWLCEHTALSVDIGYPFLINKRNIAELRDACQRVLSLNPNHDGYRNPDACNSYLPIINRYYFEAICEFGSPDSRDKSCYDQAYLDEIQCTFDALNDLLKTVDFETEVVLIQAVW